MMMRKPIGLGVPPSGSGHSQSGAASCTASPAKPSVPNADDPRLRRREFGYGGGKERPRSISAKQRALFDTFTAPIHTRISTMDDGELWAFIEACNAVSMTNCPWDAYAIARTFRDSAVYEMQQRAASAGEAGTAETAKTGSVHEHATAEGGDALAEHQPNTPREPEAGNSLRSDK